MFSRGIFKTPVTSPPPLRFPQKLWKIANECQTGAVTWSPDGKSILVRYSLFREEFMSTKNDFFKTDNISSFVRQLNLYGFRKGHEHAQKQAYKSNPDLHEFSNTFFQRDKPDLLDKVIRKSGVLRERNDNWMENRKSKDLSVINFPSTYVPSKESSFFSKLDFADDSSCERSWETVNTVAENTDHNYLSTQKPKPLTEDSNVKTLEEKISNLVVDCIHAKKEETPQTPSTVPSDKPSSQDAVPAASVKKKRGRKPGSKTNPFRLGKKFKTSKKNHDCPVMKNPHLYPNLMYFDDDDDGIFLRNTSRDVMLSSTMSFQETVESLALKEVMQRLRNKGGLGHGMAF